MKKTILFAVLLITVFALLVGCGNVSMGLGNYTFRKVHVDMPHFSGCLTVESWHDNETGIEVKTEEAGAIYLSEGTYILLEGNKTCPFCEANNAE